MESIILLITVVIGVIALAAICLSAFLAYRRGLVLSLLKLGTVIVSALISLALTALLSSALASVVSGLLDTEAINELTEASPTLAALISQLPAALIAPIVFCVIFVIVKAILAIVYAIIKKIPVFRVSLLKKKLWIFDIGSLCGALVGVITTCIVIVLVAMPFAGYTTLASDALDRVSGVPGQADQYAESGEAAAGSELAEINDRYISPLADCAVFKASYVLGGGAIFSSLTSVDIDGEKVKLAEEISFILDSYDTLEPIVENGFDLSTFSESEADALRDFAADIDKSTLITSLAGEIVPYAADKWLSNETFIGMSNPVNSVPELMQPLMTNVFDILATTSKDTIKGDLVTIADVIGSFAESGTFALLGSGHSADELLATLSDEGTLSSIIETLYANERTQSLINDLANIGFEAIGEAVGIPADDTEVYDDLMSDLNLEIQTALTLETAEEQLDRLSFGITSIFERHGVEIDQAQAELYAQCIIGSGIDFSASDASATADYFSLLLSAISPSPSAYATTDRLYSEPALSSEALAAIEQFKSAQSESEVESLAYLTAMISGSSPLEHGVVTIDELIVTEQDIKNTDSESISAQARAIEVILSIMSEAMEGGKAFDIKNLDTDAIARAVSGLGADDSAGIGRSVKGVLKYPLFAAGIDAKAAENLIDYMSSSSSEEGATDDIGAVMSVATVISDSEASSEEIKDAVKQLSTNITPSSSAVISDCVSAGFIDRTSSGKLTQAQSIAVSVVVKDMLDNFANISSELSEAQIEAESACLQMVIDLSLTSKTSSGISSALFASASQEESKLGMSADEFVDKLSDSVVLSETLVDEQENIKTAVGTSMKQQDKDLLSDALENNTEISDEIKGALVNALGLTA